MLVFALFVRSAESYVQRSRSGIQSIPSSERLERDRQIAALFAPVIHQGLGDHPRGDYITNFDFDGDWRGDNNWENLDNLNYKLRAYVYFSVIETTTHYFIHFATFHPRDYKGGLVKSELLICCFRKVLRKQERPDRRTGRRCRAFARK